MGTLTAYPSTVDTILPCLLHSPQSRDTVILPGLLHRLNICEKWDIPCGSRLLDVGCGQGESTVVLATVLGQTSHVTGIDNAPPDYGGPYTVGQSQGHVLDSSLGSRIAFIRSDPIAFLRGGGSATQFDAAVFCHSLWYFSSPSVILDIFHAMSKAGIPKIYFAEWTGTASHEAQEPHALAAEAQMLLYAQRPLYAAPGLQEQNVRGAVIAEELLRLAERAGWVVARRGTLPTPETMRDGHFEAKYLTSSRFEDKVEDEVKDVKVKQQLLEYPRVIKEKLANLGQESKGVVSMDVLYAELRRAPIGEE